VGSVRPIATQADASLCISEHTAATHVQHILDKLDFSWRARIATCGVQQGIKTPACLSGPSVKVITRILIPVDAASARRRYPAGEIPHHPL